MHFSKSLTTTACLHCWREFWVTGENAGTHSPHGTGGSLSSSAPADRWSLSLWPLTRSPPTGQTEDTWGAQPARGRDWCLAFRWAELLSPCTIKALSSARDAARGPAAAVDKEETCLKSLPSGVWWPALCLAHRTFIRTVDGQMRRRRERSSLRWSKQGFCKFMPSKYTILFQQLTDRKSTQHCKSSLNTPVCSLSLLLFI